MARSHRHMIKIGQYCIIISSNKSLSKKFLELMGSVGDRLEEQLF
jgi:hypothetical protein